MPTTNQPSKGSHRENLGRKYIPNKTVYIAIAFVIVITIVAMTGVYFEYW